MIAQFPSFYPDELVYSILARYYTRTGYMRYIFAAEDLEPTFTTFMVGYPFLSVIFDPVMRNHRYRLSFFMITTCTMSFLNTVY